MRKSWHLFASKTSRALVRGLQTRYQKYQHAVSANSVQSQMDIERLAAEFDREMEKARSQQLTKETTFLTGWDDEVDSAWRVMEVGSLGSLQRQGKRLAKVKQEFESQRDAETKSYKANREKTVKEFEVVRKHPGKRFEQRAGELHQLVAKNREVFQQSETLLQARYMKPRPVDTTTPLPTFTSLKDLYPFLQAQQKTVTDALHQMRYHPAALWSETWRLFVGAGLIGGLAAGGAYWMQLQVIMIIGAGIGAAILAMAAIWLGLRPALAGVCRRVFPQSATALAHLEGGATLAKKMLEQECQAELQRLKSEFEKKIREMETKHQQVLDDLQKNFERDSNAIRVSERNVRQQMATLHVESVQNYEKKHHPQLDKLVEEHSFERSGLEHRHRKHIQGLREEFSRGLNYLANRVQQATESTTRIEKTLDERLSQIFPDWNEPSPWSKSPLDRQNEAAILPVGRLQFEVHQPVDEQADDEQAVPQATRLQAFQGTLPVLYRIVEDGCLILEASDAPGRKRAQATLRNLLMRSLTSLPAAGFQVTVIDPDGLGKDFSWIMHLADSDPKIVNYRVWTQGNHIAEQLGRLSHHTEDVIQQLLRDRYSDIRAYNRDAGSMAEPIRLVVWSRFPTGLDENSWRMLCSLIASGGRCGVGVILQWDSSIPWPSLADQRRLSESGLWIRYPQDDAMKPVHIVDPVLGPFPVQLAEPPSEDLQSRLLEKCAQEALAGGRIEVPFASLVPADEPLGTMSSADGLAIPLGQAGVGRSQLMRLGLGTAQHVLIAGKTGSGKSSLLHTMVTSAALRYAPDQLRLVLLDFKKGVEFQVYSEASIPHADIIGIESQREFGLSTLEYLDRVMQRRGEMFRAASVQDVASWVQKNPTIPMPRILVVIDEFQELFVEDDKLAQQCSMLLDRVVRQGRSFGMHVVLASQTLGGAYSLPRTTLAQMAVRIALQCEGSDAMIILSEDNLAAERLRHAGQAVYNDASGRVEGNQPFQVAYLSKKEQQKRLALIPPQQVSDASNNFLGKCIVFEGHKPAIWESPVVTQCLKDASASDPRLLNAIVGDSVSIEPSVMIPWARQAGRNVLIVGPEDRNAANVLAAILASSAYSARSRLQQPLTIAFLDGTRPDDQYAARLPELVRLLGEEPHIADVRSAEPVLQWVHSQLEARSADPDSPYPPIMLVISQIGRFRELRKSDDFSFGGDDGPMKADKMLESILRDGPSLGIHSLLWADNYNTVSRAISRQSMHDLELKILMQMSSNDSNHLIDSPTGNRLDSHVLLLHDEATGLSRKFRPYQLDDFSMLSKWSQDAK